MAWGIPGNVGDIYAKQQSDELRDQLLKQEMAQRIRAFEAEQIYRQQQMAAQAEERRALQEERQADRADRLTQRQRQGAMDTIAISGPGPTTEAVAGPISAYAPTASLITRRNVLPSTALGGLSQEDTSGPQNFPVREPTPPELESTRERVRRGELTRVISGVNRADPNWRAKLAAQFADVDPKGALSQVLEPTEAERVAARRGDLEDAARIAAKYREPRQGPQPNYVWYRDAQGNVREAPEGTARPGETKYDEVATRQQEAAAAAQQAVAGEAANTAEEIERLATSLRKHPGFSGAFGLYSSALPTARQETANAEILLDRIKGLLTLENTGKLKGVLSDADMKVLRQASTSLDARMGEPAAAEELKRLEVVMARAKERAAQQPRQPLKPRTGETLTPGRGAADATDWLKVPAAQRPVGAEADVPNLGPSTWTGRGWAKK